MITNALAKTKTAIMQC